MQKNRNRITDRLWIKGGVTILLICLFVCLLGIGYSESQFPAFSTSEKGVFLTRLSEMTMHAPVQIAISKTFNGLREGTMYSEKITLVAVGDIMFHQPQITAAYDAASDAYDFTGTFSEITPYIQSADYALANFETTTAGEDRGYSGYPMFNVPDAALDAIQGAGFDFLSTANNHAFDKKLYGVDRTIGQMNARGFTHTGTFAEGELTQDGIRFATQDVGGVMIGILSATYGLNGFEQVYDAETLENRVNLIDEEMLKTQLEKMSDQGIDLKIVFIHWGNEYQDVPASTQTELAEKLFDWGADVILGSHPHVIQKSAYQFSNGKKRYVIYSMGNFLSNQNRTRLTGIVHSERTEDGVMVYLIVSKNRAGQTRLDGVSYVPTWVYRKIENGQLVYTILPVDEETYLSGEAANWPESVLVLMKESYDRTVSKLN